MRYLKSFNESLQFPTDRLEIIKNLHQIAPASWEHNQNLVNRIQIHPDGTVDITGGDIVIDVKGFQTRFPIKFGYVEGRFTIWEFSELTTLEGCPHTCESFSATGCKKITSLEGCPQNVIEDYRLGRTKITSLEGLPKHFTGYLDLEETPITSLEGCPKHLEKLDISGTNLLDFRGGPETVETELRASNNILTSLEGLPKSIGTLVLRRDMGRMHSNWVLDPSGLKDCKIGNLQISNQLFEEIIDLFNDTDYKFNSLKDRILRSRVVKNFIESLDYNYIRGPVDQPYINLFRLKEALSEFGMENPLGYKKTLDYYKFRDEQGKVVDFDGNPL